MDEITVLEYNSDQNYSIGDFVLYNNNIYKCIKDINRPQDEDQDQEQNLKEEYWSIEIAYGLLCELLEDNNLEYDENNNVIESHYDNNYVPGEKYKIDDIVIYGEENNIYTCIKNTDGSQNPSNTEYWEKQNEDIDDDDDNYVPGKEYEIGDIVIYSEDNNIYNTYTCIKDTDGSQNQNPSNTEYWKKEIDEIEFATVEDINGIEFVTNKKTSISNLSTDIDYPSAKAVYEYINNQNFIQTTDLKYEFFYNDWNTASFNNFCNSILSISKDNIGKVFLGSFSDSWVPDIPEEGKAVIEILDENYIHITLYTNNLQKYEYLFNNINNSGWF